MTENQTETPNVERTPSEHGDIVIPRPVPVAVDDREYGLEIDANGQTVEFIDYPTRKALVAALVELRDRDDVIAIDVVELGRTLRVTRDANLTPLADLVAGEVIEPPVAAVTETSSTEEATAAQIPPSPEPVETAHVGDAAAVSTEPIPVEPAEEPQEAISEVVEPAPGQEPIEALNAPEIAAPALEEDAPVIEGLSRDELRELNTNLGLGVEIPNSGPLGPVRDRIEAAIAARAADAPPAIP